MEKLLEINDGDYEDSVGDLIYKDWLKFDNEALSRKGPPGVLCVRPTL